MDLTLPSVGTLGQSKDENVPIQIPSEKFHSSPTPSNSSELKKEAVSLNYCPTCDKVRLGQNLKSIFVTKGLTNVLLYQTLSMHTHILSRMH